MFYTGVDQEGRGQVQRVRAGTSTALMTWHKHPGVVLESDARWYEKLSDDNWQDEPSAIRGSFATHPTPWHMLIAARARTVPQYDRGIVGTLRLLTS